MLLRMMRRSLLEPSSAVSRVVLACALALACVASSGCKKDEKAGADAGDDAAADAAVAVADAAVAVADAAPADAAVAPLATVAPKVIAKPKFVDPPICAHARNAKQRNSPAAPGLERQCVAAGGVM